MMLDRYTQLILGGDTWNFEKYLWFLFPQLQTSLVVSVKLSTWVCEFVHLYRMKWKQDNFPEFRSHPYFKALSNGAHCRVNLIYRKLYIENWIPFWRRVLLLQGHWCWCQCPFCHRSLLLISVLILPVHSHCIFLFILIPMACVFLLDFDFQTISKWSCDQFERNCDVYIHPNIWSKAYYCRLYTCTGIWLSLLHMAGPSYQPIGESNETFGKTPISIRTDNDQKIAGKCKTTAL